ncbi:hypothetical protein BGX26_003735 [Mortierella sp. AD094]|nr:hypothetical protein BGX26_003735 [Mortierella sp. AD094]
MVHLSQVLVAVTALVLTAKTADASFAICLGYNSANTFKSVVGYYLWNQGGDNSRAYDSMGALSKRMTLSDNNWVVKWDSTTTIKITNSKYQFDPYLGLDALCQDNAGREVYEYHRAIYYKCYSNDASWCSQNEANHKAQCRNWIEMGSDSLSCSTMSVQH